MEGDHDVVHGVRLNQPWRAHSLSSKPLRRLWWRRLRRRLFIAAIGLGFIALAAWGLVWFMDASSGYAPKYYEPKDTERERAELQRRLEELPKKPQQ
jgi:hypothetical protein